MSDSLTVTASAGATATGEDTLATTEAVVEANDYGRVTVGRGTVDATATAEGDEAYATAQTGATVDGADISIGRTATTPESGGATTASSTTRFVAVDIEGVDFEQGPIAVSASSDHDAESQPAAIDGNVAAFEVDVEVTGDNTYATVDAAVTTTSGFSESSIEVMAMADNALF